jgi:hypothetical protein
VLRQDFAALRLSFSPEMPSYAQKRPSDKKFHKLKLENHKSLILCGKLFSERMEFSSALI